MHTRDITWRSPLSEGFSPNHSRLNPSESLKFCMSPSGSRGDFCRCVHVPGYFGQEPCPVAPACSRGLALQKKGSVPSLLTQSWSIHSIKHLVQINETMCESSGFQNPDQTRQSPQKDLGTQQRELLTAHAFKRDIFKFVAIPALISDRAYERSAGWPKTRPPFSLFISCPCFRFFRLYMCPAAHPNQNWILLQNAHSAKHANLESMATKSLPAGLLYQLPSQIQTLLTDCGCTSVASTTFNLVDASPLAPRP